MFCRLSSTFFWQNHVLQNLSSLISSRSHKKVPCGALKGFGMPGPYCSLCYFSEYIMCLRCLARRQQESRIPNSWIMQRNFVASSCCLVCLLPSRCLTRSSRPPLPGLRAEEDGGRERAHQTGVWTLLWRVHRERRPGGGVPESAVGAGEAVDGTAVGTSELGFLRAPRRRRRTI